jgi:glycerol kinase
MIGMTLGTQKGHIVRALLEGPCFRSMEVVDAMKADSGKDVPKISVDGGMTVNDLMM